MKCSVYLCLLFLQLAYSVTWKKLKDVFRMAGNVTHADVFLDDQNKSRGMATVTFESPFEAVNAICILFSII